MLEQILGLIQQNSQAAIVQNPAIPNENNNDVMQTLLGAITGGLQDHAQNGNMQGVMGLLSGHGSGNGMMNNPIVASIAGNAISSMMQRFGLSNDAASGIVGSVLPGVLSGLVSKVSNPNDSSLDFNDLLGGLTGGNSAQSQGSGLDFNQIGYALADGKLDMSDLMRVGGSMMGGGNNTSPAPQQGGGMDLGGLLGGLLGGK
ncbi:hypothetical protein DYBT9275_01977 [Dyadobacter sp. CECT 9275]|uniref:DUF937 domain-containing protein n=1 Tax=Dyadobacter helix TaxID=2822344 RepID=A0A916JA01_9BACT|nr:DUF937 domain-containing protein [Dyadobacter sp. CECT 9275]CAG4998324.1 hypothetical protein DYBT9275_01977 [Dyadobacter sp. CECT 9275]